MAGEQVYRITLVRHGESVANAERRLQGHIDYPLSDRGRAQAFALARRWKAEAMAFDQVIASPLMRAVDTARIVAAELKTSPPEVDPRWIEQDLGEHGGRRWEDIERAAAERDGVAMGDATVQWAESETALRIRADETLDSLLQRPPGRYLVVSHRALLNAVLFSILGMPSQPDGRQRTRFRIANGSFSRVRYDRASGQWLVYVIGDAAHCRDGELAG